jgi:hypothetical protein
MNLKEIRLGGCVGATIAFLLGYLTRVALLLHAYFNDPNTIISCSTLLFEPLRLAIALALFGFFAGRVADGSRSVNHAFLRGGCIFLGVLFFVTFIVSLTRSTPKDDERKFIAFALFFGLFALGGSLLSGLSAIFVRDYRQFKRFRPIPQFSLQELLIVITLIIVIISFISSIALWL